MTVARRTPFPHAGPWGDVSSQADRDILAALGETPDRDAVVRALRVAKKYGAWPRAAGMIVAALLGMTNSNFEHTYPGIHRDIE
jgi:hypothetical protein